MKKRRDCYAGVIRCKSRGELYDQVMFGLPEVLEFLHSHHVEEGCDVQVIQKMTDGVIIAVQDTRFVLGNEIADRIQV